jgi:hypothetical protein
MEQWSGAAHSRSILSRNGGLVLRHECITPANTLPIFSHLTGAESRKLGKDIVEVESTEWASGDHTTVVEVDSGDTTVEPYVDSTSADDVEYIVMTGGSGGSAKSGGSSKSGSSTMNVGSKSGWTKGGSSGGSKSGKSFTSTTTSTVKVRAKKKTWRTRYHVVQKLIVVRVRVLPFFLSHQPPSDVSSFFSRSNVFSPNGFSSTVRRWSTCAPKA